MIVLDQILRILGRKTASVLVFHKVPGLVEPTAPDEPNLVQFERLLDLVMEHFKIVPLRDIANGLATNSLPENTVAITFDDGYQDWMHGVVPILLRRGVHATFFLTTSQFDGVPLWHERVNHAVRTIKEPILQIVGSRIELPTLSIADKKIATIWLQNHLKYQDLESRNQTLNQIEEVCGSSPSFAPYMKIGDLRAIHSMGFGIGAHTVNHPILTSVTEDIAMNEIGESREVLESIVGGRVDSFAYPNGRPTIDFLSQHINMVRRAGYQYAVTTDYGVARLGTSLFQIPRFTPWGPDKTRMTIQIVRNQIVSGAKLKE